VSQHAPIRPSHPASSRTAIEVNVYLWLGHESTDATQIYLHADMSIKERALARTAPTSTGIMHR
jgi:hypothetical protein